MLLAMMKEQRLDHLLEMTLAQHLVLKKENLLEKK